MRGPQQLASSRLGAKCVAKSRDGGDTQPPWPLLTAHAGPRRGWVRTHAPAPGRPFPAQGRSRAVNRVVPSALPPPAGRRRAIVADEPRWRERARVRARAPACPASSVFVLMEPACSWRVSSHVPRPRGGWALATGTRGRVADPPRTDRKLLLRYSLAGLVAVWVRRHSIPASRLFSPPTPSSGPETQQRDRVDLPGVLYHWTQTYLHGSSSRLRGVIDPRALELIPIPTLIARELKSKESLD